jgi:hypothetical protein
MAKKKSGKGKNGKGKKDKPVQLDLFGTDPKYLHRREGPDTSINAAYLFNSKTNERRVLAVIETFDAVGCISDEVRASFPEGTSYSSVTARYVALDGKGYIRRNKLDTRKGEKNVKQMVMRITPAGRNALNMSNPDGSRKDPLHPIPG